VAHDYDIEIIDDQGALSLLPQPADAVLEIMIDPGPPVEVLVPGVQGPPGPTGNTGPTGPAGPQGVPGYDGSRIIAKQGPPLPTDGQNGWWCFDQLNSVLYGPKNEQALGPAESMIPSSVPNGDNGVGPYMLGTEFKPNVDGTITSIRFYRCPNAVRTTRNLRLWRGTIQVAAAVSSGESGSGWRKVDLATPVPVTAGTNYTVGYEVDNYSYGNSTPASESPNLSWVTLHYGPEGGYPVNTSGGNYLADVEFHEAALVWPEALRGIVVLSQAEYDALSTKPTKTIYVVI
jgi:hypothetical protein